LGGNADFTYGVTNTDTSMLNQTLFGKKKIGPIPRLFKVLDTKPFLAQKLSHEPLSKILSLIPNTLLQWRYPESLVIPDGMHIKQIDRFDERFDTFWQQIKEDYPIMTVRDSSYLNWRYGDAKHMNHEVFCLERMATSEIVGFIALGERQRDFLVGQIYDILTPRRKDPMITRCLLRFAINRFRQKKAAVARCWMFPHSHVYPELIKIGFVPRERKGFDLHCQYVNVKNSAIPADIVEDSENWYLSIGDADMG
ncbi:MAG: hypothetical protein ACFFCW_02955, partial [Candidatus Hodarchaeota archaeon]